jgi:polyhydroxyalkanoate synthesis regulator phasin
MADQTTPVSFRLDAHYLERLKQEASKYGMSTGEFARRLVLDVLERSEEQRTADEIVGLRRDVVELRVDIAVAVTALLVHAGKVSHEEAEAWVRETLRP